MKRWVSMVGLALLAAAPFVTSAADAGREAQDAKTVTELGAYLKKYPEADADRNGALTMVERDAHRLAKILQIFPAGATNRHVRVPMRDGVTLATELFLPPGAGPWPVVLIRSGYDRWSAAMGDLPQLKNQPVALVTQDVRGDGDSGGTGTFDPYSFDNEIDDGYDTVEWIAAQPWCNGRVGMWGASFHGYTAYMAMLANPPHLTVVETVNSGGNACLYWTFQNGVRRYMYRWLKNKGTPISEWPRPTLQLFDREAYAACIARSAESNQTIFIARSGWYDIFAESALDYLAAYGASGKVFVTMGASGHGAMQGRPFPPPRLEAPAVVCPAFLDVLMGRCSNMPTQSVLRYNLMGDALASNAPGNIVKVAHTWPVPNTATPFYLLKTGGLSRQVPAATNTGLTFACSPTNPVPTRGGAQFGSPGPMDQRPLNERPDILRFVSDPLSAPLEITGKVRAKLYISSDVPDTLFVVKVMDVYPDGYAALVREGAMMARFWQGLNRPAPLEKGRVYCLDMDLWSTAYVFNAGHRLAVHIAGSDDPKYEVHPNSYQPVASFASAPAAHNTVHLSGDHASCVILPMIGNRSPAPQAMNIKGAP